MSKYSVCPDCEGEGTVLRASMRGCAYTMEEMAEEGVYGMTFGEEMQSGMYDVTCPTCHGKRVVTQDELQAYQDLQEWENSWEARFERGCCGGY